MTVAEWSTIANLATALGTLILAVGDVGFWQGAFRDTAAAGYEQARAAIEARRPWSVELLYADHEGGQRAISRFLALPVDHQFVAQPGDRQHQAGETKPGWLASASRHWSLDRQDAP